MALNLFDPKIEYDKDPNLKPEDVKALMDWVNKQPHLPEINEVQAILFLNCSNYSNETAKSTIDTYFTVKTLCSDLFLDRNPLNSPLKENMDIMMQMVLPKKTPEGYSIFYLNFLDCNPDNYIFPLQLKYFDMTMMRHLHQEGTSKGHLIAVDMKGVVLGHLTKFGPLTMKKFIYYLQDAIPLKLKGLHYFNVVPFMDTIFGLMRPFMKKELFEMFHLHTDVEGLLKFIPLECLPAEYGGEAPKTTILHETSKAKIFENSAFFEWENKLLVDESNRPGKPKNVGDYFGIEGTFKKLELD